MSRLSRGLGAALVGGTLAAACSLSGGLDGLQGGEDVPPAKGDDAGILPGPPEVDGGRTPGSGEGGAPEAGQSEEADAAAPPMTNVHPNGTFESGCGGWTGFAATATTASTARSGMGSCRSCAEPGATGVYGLSDNGALAPSVGSTYRATAFVRDVGGQVPAARIAFFLRTFNFSGGFQQVEIVQGTELATASSTWTKVEVTMKVNVPAQWLQVGITGAAPPTGCFLLDDVELVRLP